MPLRTANCRRRAMAGIPIAMIGSNTGIREQLRQAHPTEPILTEEAVVFWRIRDNVATDM
jgi:hypothetical protein